MLNRAVKIVTLVLIPLSVIAAPKVKENVTLQVVTTTTRIHGAFTNDAFAYTDLMFTEFNGKKVVYECVQRGDVCPMVEAGKSYTVNRNGDTIFISMSSPEAKKAFPVKFKQVGSW
jgi:hypothetical protein